MKFFDRKTEIATLRQIRDRAKESAQFTVLTGRRRIGKTSLVLKAYEDTPILYFFVGRKTETLLCQEFKEEVEEKLGVKLGGVPQSFSQLFEYLMVLSCKESFTLFIDEFQNFEKVNPSVFSDMQRIWDLNHMESRINLVVCGSIYSMMTKIFRDYKEPLYNRQNRFMHIKPFAPSVLKEILAEYHPEYTAEDLLALYAFTGGVAKYIQLLVNDNALTLDRMIESMINAESTFINEGKSILIEEFGKEYDTYFSILSAIASGMTRRAEIEQMVGKAVSGHLTRLEDDYGIISKKLPLGAKPLSKNAIYVIRDNFFTFWFRFIYKYAHFLEVEAYAQLRTLIKRDYNVFSGIMLERYFYAKALESQQYTTLGQWWDRKGENEIDLIVADELDARIMIAEVKRNRNKISIDTLREKSERLFIAVPEYKKYSIEYKALSMEDM